MDNRNELRVISENIRVQYELKCVSHAWSFMSMPLTRSDYSTTQLSFHVRQRDIMEHSNLVTECQLRNIGLPDKKILINDICILYHII